jgi:hypothetical protein
MIYLVEITDAVQDYPLGVYSTEEKAHEAAKLFIGKNYTFKTLGSAADYVITRVEIDKDIG